MRKPFNASLLVFPSGHTDSSSQVHSKQEDHFRVLHVTEQPGDKGYTCCEREYDCRSYKTEQVQNQPQSLICMAHIQLHSQSRLYQNRFRLCRIRIV